MFIPNPMKNVYASYSHTYRTVKGHMFRLCDLSCWMELLCIWFHEWFGHCGTSHTIKVYFWVKWRTDIKFNSGLFIAMTYALEKDDHPSCNRGNVFWLMRTPDLNFISSRITAGVWAHIYIRNVLYKLQFVGFVMCNVECHHRAKCASDLNNLEHQTYSLCTFFNIFGMLGSQLNFNCQIHRRK